MHAISRPNPASREPDTGSLRAMTVPIARIGTLRWNGLVLPIAQLMDCLAGGYESGGHGSFAYSKL